MPRRPNVVCAGICGELIWVGSGSLPPGQAICRSCRSTKPRVVRSSYRPRPLQPCATCGQPCVRKAKVAYCDDHRGSTWLCEVCSQPYKRTYAKQRTCGRRCGWELRVREGKVPVKAPPKAVPIRTVQVRSCYRCGAEFTGPGWKFCSATCRDAPRVQERRDKYCNGCGVDIEGSRIRCDDCITKAKRARKRREKARRRGVAHEPYTLGEIALRDKHRCQLCGKSVPMDKAVPHPLAPTIDHVLPLSRGGDDTRANVQLAHFECNWRKGDGGSQQLALVG